MNVPATSLAFPHGEWDCIRRGRTPSFRSAHPVPTTFRGSSSVTVTAVTLRRAIDLHFVFASSTRSLLAFPSVSPISFVSHRPPVIISPIAIPVVSSITVASVVTVPVPVTIATVAVPSFIMSRRAVSVLVVPVVIYKEKDGEKDMPVSKIAHKDSVCEVSSVEWVHAFNSAFPLRLWWVDCKC